MDALQTDENRLNSAYWMERRNALFLASCIALIVTAMSFAIRGDALINALGGQFKLSGQQIGLVVGTAFWGFTLAMIIGGPLCDVLGMGRLLSLATSGHALGIVMTVMARDFWSLFFSTLAFGLANGFVEAACNPLVATLYPDQKIRRLNLFHVWFPGGIVFGGLVSFAITQLGWGGERGWKIAMLSMLLPLAIYTFLFLGKKFPATERVASGVSTAQMWSECLRPLFLLFVSCMLLTAATELGTTTWMPSILTHTTGVQGILFVVWIFGLMALGRAFAGPLIHRISPMGTLIGSSLFAIIGLYLISHATAAAAAFVGATVFAMGVCFFWPTMLGVVSERFPRTGALGLAVMGGAGMLSVSIILPIIGRTYDAQTAAAAGGQATLDVLKNAGAASAASLAEAQSRGGAAALQQVVWLPVITLIVFSAIHLYDRARGGYREEVLVQEQAA
jgi:MFS family permease